MAGDEFVCALPPTARSVTQARRFVVDALMAMGHAEHADTAALLTSEVVTNAVLHARTDITLAVRGLRDGVSIEVSDGSRRKPRGRRSTPQSTTGRGLELLEQLASSWDVTMRARGKTIQFSLRDGHDPWAAFTGPDWAVEQ